MAELDALKFNASTYLELDEGLIPEGNLNLSSRTSKLDHNFCLSLKPQEIQSMSGLKSKAVCLQINMTEPGLQVLDGNGLDVPVSGTQL